MTTSLDKTVVIAQIDDNRRRVMKLVDGIPMRTRAIATLLESDSVGAQYFTSPASSRVDFHSAYPGGLAAHSLNVLDQAIELMAAVPEFTGLSMPSVVLVSLFHDLGKAGDEDGPLYVPQTTHWKAEKGELFTHNTALRPMSVPDRTLFMLQRYGVMLEHEEFLAMRLHDGQYVQENKWYSMKEPALAILLHWADLAATRQEKNAHRPTGEKT